MFVVVIVIIVVVVVVVIVQPLYVDSRLRTF